MKRVWWGRAGSDARDLSTSGWGLERAGRIRCVQPGCLRPQQAHHESCCRQEAEVTSPQGQTSLIPSCLPCLS